MCSNFIVKNRIMRFSIFCLFIITIAACINEGEKLPIQHEKLLGFKAVFVDLPNNRESQNELVNLKKKEDKIRYLEDIIYVSVLNIESACGNFYGNIECSNDTIYLKYEHLSGDLCKSLEFFKLTYLINNNERKRWTIIEK